MEFSTVAHDGHRPSAESEVRNALETLCAGLTPFVVELRALDVAVGNGRPRNMRGYFNDLDLLAKTAAGIKGAKGVYVTMNAVHEAVFARAANKLCPMGPHDAATRDNDVVRRRWLLLDVDSRRPAGVSAKNEEVAATAALGNEMRSWLREFGWPDPMMVVMSGNGMHLYYAIDLRPDDNGLVERVLRSVAFHLDNAAAFVDRTVHNAARIVRLPGTFAAKGDDTEDRPHRRARVVDLPEDPGFVSHAQLELVASQLPDIDSTRDARRGHGGAAKGEFDIHAWMAEHAPDAIGPTDWNGGSKWVFSICPFNGEHRNRSAYVVQLPSGAVAAGCHHNGCSGKTWPALRDVLEPGWRDSRHASENDVSVVLVPVSEVEVATTSWLWENRIPLRAISLIDGDPGLGKSVLTCDLAARVSAGRDMPDGTPGLSGRVVILSAEDDPASTIRPRLEAAHADITRIDLIPAMRTRDGERSPELPLDVDAIEAALGGTEVRLIVVDPLSAYLASHVDAHKDQHVRRALARLKTMAERTGAAVVLVRHLNKNANAPAVYRGGGSIGIVGAARSALLVARDPDDDRRRVLAAVKSNLAEAPASLQFCVVSGGPWVAAVDWLGESKYDAAGLLGTRRNDTPRAALEEAKDFLRAELAEGPRPAKVVQREAREAGISPATLRRARQQLGVRCKKHEWQGIGVWHLHEEDKGDQPSGDDHHCRNGGIGGGRSSADSPAAHTDGQRCLSGRDAQTVITFDVTDFGQAEGT